MGCNHKLICIVSVVVALMPTLSVRARSHGAKVNTKAKKAKEQAKEIKEKISIEANFYFRFRSGEWTLNGSLRIMYMQTISI